MIVIDTKVDDLDAFKKDDGNSGNQPVQLHLEVFPLQLLLVTS